MTPLNIVPASLSDASSLARLMEQLGYPTETREMEGRLTGILLQRDYQTLVAELNSRVVGMIGVDVGRFYEKNGSYGHIVALVVEQEHCSHHIGSSLVAEGACARCG